MTSESLVSTENFSVETTAKTGPSIRRGKSSGAHGTPWEFIHAVEARFGALELDLAASAGNAKAPEFVTVAADSLAHDWTLYDQHLWLNPPYDDIPRWVAKAAATWRRQGFLHVLVPASIGTDWFAEHVRPYACVEGISPRITFEGSEDPYPKDLMLCTYGYGLTGFGTWRWKTDADRRRANRERWLAAGSCQSCGAEAVNGTTRCTPCGQRNSRKTRVRT